MKSTNRQATADAGAAQAPASVRQEIFLLAAGGHPSGARSEVRSHVVGHRSR